MPQFELAIFAGGCFWCTEAIFKRLKGVQSVIVGYTGGHTENPSYEQVCTERTGHAESIQIKFDPNQISFQTLLDVFFATHNPTILNQQDYDVGTMYRSAIFYHSDSQKQMAHSTIDKLQQSGKYSNPIVTQVVPFTKFFPSEKYHQNFYDSDPSKPYCQVVIDPKIKKLLHDFSSQVKPEYTRS